MAQEASDLPPGTITTIAGGGAGDGGPGAEAPVAWPGDVATDGHGDLYIAEQGGARIRKVDADTGVISTVAGDGFPGHAGDGGPAVAARIRAANVAADAEGNLYFGESVPVCVVRKVEAATGIISTVAGPGPTPCQAGSGDGGPARQASFQRLTSAGIAVGADGSVYVSDFLDHSVRRIDPSGTITTVAGNGTYSMFQPEEGNKPATQASLGQPEGLAVDAAGNLFIGDASNIWRVDAVSGLLTRYAFGPTRGTVPCTGGPSSSPCAGRDGQEALGAVAEGTSGLALDRAGNLYAADWSLALVRKITPGGKLYHVAGGCDRPCYGGWSPRDPYLDDGEPAIQARLLQPKGVAVDPSGRVYVASFFDHLVHRIDADGRIHVVAGNGTGHFYGDRVPAPRAGFDLPAGMAQDAAGDLYIADSGNNLIRKVDDATGLVTTVAGNHRWKHCAPPGQGSTRPGCPTDIGDGGPATEAFLALGGDRASGLMGIAADGPGNLYIADQYNCRVRRVDAETGIITTVAGTSQRTSTGECADGGDLGPATKAKLGTPRWVALDRTGNLYISQYNLGAEQGFHDCRVRKVDANTGIITTVAGTGGCGYNGSGAAAAVTQLAVPGGLAVDRVGNLFIAEDHVNCLVRRVDAQTGIITTVAGGGPLPGGVANLLRNSQVRLVDPCGYSGDGGLATEAQLNRPRAVAVDRDANVYIADAGFNHRVRRVDVDTGMITTFAGTGKGGNFAPTYPMYPAMGDYSGDGGPATSAGVAAPYGVLVDAEGDLLIADAGPGRIRQVTGGGH